MIMITLFFAFMQMIFLQKRKKIDKIIHGGYKMANYKKLKEKLYEARTSRDLTRDYVIERLNKMGIKYNQSSLARIESGDIKNVKPELLRALCEIYNLDIAEMFSLAGMDNFLKALNIITEVKSFNIGIPLYNTIAST